MLGPFFIVESNNFSPACCHIWPCPYPVTRASYAYETIVIVHRSQRKPCIVGNALPTWLTRSSLDQDIMLPCEISVSVSLPTEAPYPHDLLRSKSLARQLRSPTMLYQAYEASTFSSLRKIRISVSFDQFFQKIWGEVRTICVFPCFGGI